jgi:hypothetical protein
MNRSYPQRTMQRPGMHGELQLSRPFVARRRPRAGRGMRLNARDFGRFEVVRAGLWEKMCN